MRRETPMSAKHLPSHHIPHTQFSLSHVPNMISLWVHDHVSIRLLKAQHHIHELQLPRHHNGGIRQYACGGMIWGEDAIRVAGDVDG